MMGEKVKSAILGVIAAASIALVAYNLYAFATGQAHAPKSPTGPRIVVQAR